MSERKTETSHGVSRRRFLTGLGIGLGGAGVAGTATGVSLGRTDLRDHTIVPGNFSRLFPDLQPFYASLRVPGATAQLQDALRDIGKRGGLMDANDQLSAGPVALIADAKVNGNDPPTNPDNTTHTAGVTFFGQLMDFDVTFDASSPLGTPTDPTTIQNMHVPQYDLDIVYGSGPFATPQYYSADDPVKLRIESGGIFEDLPRTADGTAIIPDPRTDQHLMIQGLHCAAILFHNNAVDYVRRSSSPRRSASRCGTTTG